MRTRRTKQEREIDRYIGNRIARARLQAGIPQWQIAAVLGVTIGPIQHIEHGRSGVVPSQLVVIANLTGRPISYFFGDGAP